MQPRTGRVRTPGRAAGHRRAAVTLRIMAFTDDPDGDRFFALRTFFALLTLAGRFRRHGGRPVCLEIELAGDLPLLRR